MHSLGLDGVTRALTLALGVELAVTAPPLADAQPLFQPLALAAISVADHAAERLGDNVADADAVCVAE